MKLKGLLLFFMFLFALVAAHAQQYNYRHYTTQDGLPSSTVYSMVQDDEGYIWFSTSQGVARYDGYKFKTYTVLDGLPDNDVLAILKGQNGRLWFVAFNKEVSYYDAETERIKIFEEYNLPTLAINVIETPDNKKWVGTRDKGLLIFDNNHEAILLDTDDLPMVDNYFHPFLDRDNKIWLSGRMRFFKYDNPQRIYDLNKHSFLGELDNLGDFARLHQLRNGTIVCYIGRHVFALEDNLLKSIFTTIDIETGIIINSVTSDSENNLLIATQAGAFLVPNDTSLPYQRFLKEKPLSHFYEDQEGNYWFTSLNEGTYMLSSASRLVKNISTKDGLSNSKVSSVFLYGNDVLFSTHNGEVGGWLNNNLVHRLVRRFYYHDLNNCYAIEDSVSICSSNFGAVVLKQAEGLLNANGHLQGYNGYDSLLHKDSFLLPLKPQYLSLGGVKYMVKGATNEFWLAGQCGLIKIRYDSINKVLICRRVLRERVTALCFDDRQKLWFTSLDSIGCVDGESVVYLDQLDSFGIKGNVTKMIKGPNNYLWLGTSGYGMYVYDGDSLYNINLNHGLSNAFITQAIALDERVILGTSSGINIVHSTVLPPYYSQVNPLSVNDALVSQEINALLLHDDMLYVGTNDGVSLIPFGTFSVDTVPPRLYLTRFQINDNDTLLKASYVLPYDLNNIKFEYLGLLYKADGNLLYRYQMEGVDTGWVQTAFTNVQYPTLPPGKYTFKVDARSLQGPWSDRPATMQITILPPFWKTWWFRLLMVLLLVGIVTGIIYGTIKYYRNQSIIAQRIVKLEGQALRAQMNPHFIFNALNAIHDFIANQDERSAHLYLGKFALLIRKILDQSRKQEIALEEEIITLKLYLELEALRFPQRFEYQIECDEALLENEVHIPPMLVQPYVENAIRHGLMNNDKTGRLRVVFKQVGVLLEVMVEDNGIGREKAREVSSKRLVNHRSAGMEITQQRITLQDTENTSNNKLTITDLFNADNIASGTRITFYVSLVNGSIQDES